MTKPLSDDELEAIHQRTKNDCVHLNAVAERDRRALLAEVDRIKSERDGWIESAAQFHRNAEYYAGLVDQVAAFLGPNVFVSDDGSVQDNPLRAKVPEMVGHLSRLDKLAREWLKMQREVGGDINHCEDSDVVAAREAYSAAIESEGK